LTLLLVMVGAAVGAPSRWLLDQAIQNRRDTVFPLGTWTINVSGSFLLGVILGATALGPGSAPLVALAGTGFCGGFTTYSTFGFETVRLAEDRSYLEAGLNIVSSLGFGLVAAFGGWYLGQAL
jgi:fluoride exporter